MVPTVEQYVAHYLSRASPVSQSLRRRKRNAIHVEASAVLGKRVVIQLVTAKSGYPLLSQVVPTHKFKDLSRPHLDSFVTRLYQWHRVMRCSPSEYAVFNMEEPFSVTHPSLHHHLTCDFWSDGRPRNRSRLNVWCEDTGWKGFVRDYNTRLLLWGSGESLAALLNVLDGRIACGDRTLWRRDRFYHGDSK